MYLRISLFRADDGSYQAWEVLNIQIYPAHVQTMQTGPNLSSSLVSGWSWSGSDSDDVYTKLSTIISANPDSNENSDDRFHLFFFPSSMTAPKPRGSLRTRCLCKELIFLCERAKVWVFQSPIWPALAESDNNIVEGRTRNTLHSAIVTEDAH